jgi:Immunity protein 72
VLEDAYHHAQHEYVVHYIGDTNQGSWVFYGKYVAAMKAALLWASENGGFAGAGLQPGMANLSASEVWTETRQITDVDGQRKLRKGTHDSLLEETAHLKELPRIPEISQEIFVRTGEPCPVFGIYEPQVKDGVMTYMCQGQEAYRYGEPCFYPGGGQPVTWKLIWEDTRYLDGVIPEEEKDYFAEPQTPPDFSTLVGEEIIDEWPHNEVVTAHSGQIAKYTGTWAATGDLQGRIYWKKGEPLPLHKGREVQWVYSGV